MQHVKMKEREGAGAGGGICLSYIRPCVHISIDPYAKNSVYQAYTLGLINRKCTSTPEWVECKAVKRKIPTLTHLYTAIFIYTSAHTALLRGGGLGSSTIFNKFHETYAPS